MHHRCHRHQFSKFPDASLIKILFPWPNKYKISDIEAASSLRFQKTKHRWGRIDLKCFFQPSMVLKQQCYYFNFPDFSSNVNFSLTFPWPSFFFKFSLNINFLTCINPVYPHAQKWIFLQETHSVKTKRKTLQGFSLNMHITFNIYLSA